MERFIIIGAGNAGLTCAKTLRKFKNNANITLISHENYPPYCRCLLTYFIENEINENSLFDQGKKQIENLDLDYIQGYVVEEIDVENQKIYLSSGKKLSYDKLFISSGAKAKEFQFENDNSILVSTLRNFDDAKRIKSNFKKGDIAVVEGGGLVSLKTLLALNSIGVKVYWVIKSKNILSFLLDSESALIIEKFFEGKEIKLIKNSKILEVNNKTVKLNTGVEIKCNGVVVGKGVEPNEIESGKKINFDNGYDVNEYFQTNIENIYAGGDCAKIFDKAHNKKWKIPLWPIAGISGVFAGKNMAGYKAEFKGAVPINSFSVFNNNIIAGGKKRIEESEMDEFFEFSEMKGKIYKKYILDKDENLKGFVFINDIFKSGRYYWEIAGGGL